MLGAVDFFNAVDARVRLKSEGYCPVLDILVSLMCPPLEGEFRGVRLSAKARQNWHEKISRSCFRQSCRCRIDGLLLAVAPRFQSAGLSSASSQSHPGFARWQNWPHLASHSGCHSMTRGWSATRNL